MKHIRSEEDLMEDDNNNNIIPVPPICDPSHTYQLLWKGRKLGGMLYLTMDAEDTTKLYFVLMIPKVEDHFVGSISIHPDVTDYSNLCEVVLEQIEKCYMENENFLFQAALRTNEIRIH